MMIIILPYQSRWPGEFLALGIEFRQALGGRALRIDHIGSTSVPGLAAKDVIDIQVTVESLDPKIEESLLRTGYQRLIDITMDHRPPGGPTDPLEWSKWLFKPSASQRPVNVHVRLKGRANQRYPLLFRDYLRSHAMVAEAYGQVKSALALLHPDNVDAYYDVKDPVCDIIIGGAEDWARTSGWEQGPSDC
jgi:GrpB-like predicted nucleotidyltransferase (UPF0157 family)